MSPEFNEKCVRDTLNEWIQNPLFASAPHYLSVVSRDGTRSAAVKWDGCVDLWIYHNGDTFSDKNTKNNQDHLHICDLEGFIEQLQALRDFTLKHFDGDWPQ